MLIPRLPYWKQVIPKKVPWWNQLPNIFTFLLNIPSKIKWGELLKIILSEPCYYRSLVIIRFHMCTKVVFEHILLSQLVSAEYLMYGLGRWWWCWWWILVREKRWFGDIVFFNADWPLNHLFKEIAMEATGKYLDNSGQISIAFWIIRSWHSIK